MQFVINKNGFSFAIGTNSNIKLKVELDGVSNDRCNEVFNVKSVDITEKQLCAGGEYMKDSCRGQYFQLFSN